MEDIEGLSKWLVHNYNRKYKKNYSNPSEVIKALRRMNFSNKRIIEFAKAPNYISGVAFI